ncbi:MAG: Rieske 2Fe-2S domain-containing protein [Steroidobacteraceae bacterium]
MPSWRDHPNAPAQGSVLCAVEDIPQGSGHEVMYGEGIKKLRVVAFRDGETVWAYVNSCPHFSLPLNAKPQTFLISEHNQVMCAFHCAIFRFEDGSCIDGPAVGMGLEAVPIRIENGQVVIQAA